MEHRVLYNFMHTSGSLVQQPSLVFFLPSFPLMSEDNALIQRIYEMLSSNHITVSDLDWLKSFREVDQMLSLLKAIQLHRLDLDSKGIKTWSARYFEFLHNALLTNVNLFLITLTSQIIPFYINLFSKRRPYSKTLDTSENSGLSILSDFISKYMGASGKYILGMLGPLLGLTQSQIIRLLKYHTYMDEYSSDKYFKFIKRVYKLSNKARSDVILCVANI
jgi:hypothetical protein